MSPVSDALIEIFTLIEMAVMFRMLVEVCILIPF